MGQTRRGFIAAASAAPLAAKGWDVLTGDEAALLDALCAQIIPSDQHPGAREARVVRYIDRQLAGALKRYAKNYRNGLAALRAAVDFPALSPAAQIAYLKSMEAGEVKNSEWRLQSAKAFFEMVIDHTMQGFYGDPKHGGNEAQGSWKMLGIGDLSSSGHPHK